MPSSADKQAAAESGPAEAVWQRFWRIVIATALAGAVAIAALNALVDPTGAVHARWPDAPALCAEGPRGDIWVAATLPVRLDPPAVLVAGTSRVAVGIDQALLDQLADGRTARIVGPSEASCETTCKTPFLGQDMCKKVIKHNVGSFQAYEVRQPCPIHLLFYPSPISNPNPNPNPNTNTNTNPNPYSKPEAITFISPLRPQTQGTGKYHGA